MFGIRDCMHTVVRVCRRCVLKAQKGFQFSVGEKREGKKVLISPGEKW